jgi:hypothetical protein
VPDGLHLSDQPLSNSEGYKLFEKCRKALNVETEGEYVTKRVTSSVKNVSISIKAPNAVAVFRDLRLRLLHRLRRPNRRQAGRAE